MVKITLVLFSILFIPIINHYLGMEILPKENLKHLVDKYIEILEEALTS
ncbi:MAG: hypothetical protein O4808_09840 [Trichodesmium sp. St17_bin3_1_1]|nr:hypothetical protein [Trichodesmium sp. St17_bin3_1_1]